MKKKRASSTELPRHTAGRILCLALFCLVNLRAFGSDLPPDTDAVNALFPAAPSVSQEKSEPVSEVQANTEKSIKGIEMRLETIEARLGPTARPSSIGYNIERRLADLERRVQQLEQKQTRMLQWEQRIRRMEMK